MTPTRKSTRLGLPRFGGQLKESDTLVVGAVGAVGNAERFPRSCGNRASDFLNSGSFHGSGDVPHAACSLRFAS